MYTSNPFLKSLHSPAVHPFEAFYNPSNLQNTFHPPPSNRRLNGLLIKNADVNDTNKDTVVETLRSIAELMIWGDQHDQAIIDYFFENQMLAHFQRILNQRANRSVNDLVKQARGCLT